MIELARTSTHAFARRGACDSRGRFFDPRLELIARESPNNMLGWNLMPSRLAYRTRGARGRDNLRRLLAMDMRIDEVWQCMAPPPAGLGSWMLGPDGQSSFPAPTFYAGLYQWLTPSTVVTSGSSMTSWPDSSGSSHPCTNVGSVPPNTGYTINGAAAVKFFGSTTSYCQTAVNPVSSTFANNAVFVVVYPSNVSTSYSGLYDNYYPWSWCLCLNNNSGNPNAWKYICDQPTLPYGTAESGTPVLAPSIIAGGFASAGSTGTGFVAENGGTAATSSFPTPGSGTGGNNVIVVGGRNTGGGAPGVAGLYGDVLCYTQPWVVNTSQYGGIIGYLGAKYSITV
jgi:hypothetical protein